MCKCASKNYTHGLPKKLQLQKSGEILYMAIKYFSLHICILYNLENGKEDRALSVKRAGWFPTWTWS